MSKDYGVYSGLSENMDGSVKFVMKLDGFDADKAEKDKENKQEDKKVEASNTAATTEKKGVIDKIRSFFKGDK